VNYSIGETETNPGRRKRPLSRVCIEGRTVLSGSKLRPGLGDDAPQSADYHILLLFAPTVRHFFQRIVEFPWSGPAEPLNPDGRIPHALAF
jgi:hypothetical protein